MCRTNGNFALKSRMATQESPSLFIYLFPDVLNQAEIWGKATPCPRQVRRGPSEGYSNSSQLKSWRRSRSINNNYYHLFIFNLRCRELSKLHFSDPGPFSLLRSSGPARFHVFISRFCSLCDPSPPSVPLPHR